MAPLCLLFWSVTATTSILNDTEAALMVSSQEAKLKKLVVGGARTALLVKVLIMCWVNYSVWVTTSSSHQLQAHGSGGDLCHMHPGVMSFQLEQACVGAATLSFSAGAQWLTQISVVDSCLSSPWWIQALLSNTASRFRVKSFNTKT